MTDRLDRLALLHAVVRSGSIAAAAREVGHTPSAVSQQIAALERGVGLTLLERSNRGVQPTPAGALLADQAVVLLDGLAAAVRRAGDVAGSVQQQPVRVAAFPTAISLLLLPALAVTDVRTTIVDLEPDAALEALLDRSVDLTIVDRYEGSAKPFPPGVRHELVGTDGLRLVTTAERAEDPLHLLDDIAWVLGRATSSLGMAGRAALASAGLSPQIVAETDDHHVAFAVAQHVGAATIQPSLTLRDLPADGSLRVSEVRLPFERTIHLVRRSLPLEDPHVSRVRAAVLAATAQTRA